MGVAAPSATWLGRPATRPRPDPGGLDQLFDDGLDEAQLGAHRDALANALMDRAPRRVMRVRPLGGLALVVRAARQRVVHPDPLDDEHSVFNFDVAFRR